MLRPRQQQQQQQQQRQQQQEKIQVRFSKIFSEQLQSTVHRKTAFYN